MQASTSRGSNKAPNELDDWRILSGKRHRGSPDVYEAGFAGLVKREHRRIKLKRSQLEPDWWQSHLDKRARVGFATLAGSVADVAEPELPQAGDAVGDAVEDIEDVWEGREEHESYIPAPDKFSRDAHMQARMEALEKQALLVQAEFEKSLSRDELKLIAAQAYYSEMVAVLNDCGALHGSVAPAILIAARAACVAPATARNWIDEQRGVLLAFELECFPKTGEFVWRNFGGAMGMILGHRQ